MSILLVWPVLPVPLLGSAQIRTLQGCGMQGLLGMDAQLISIYWNGVVQG